MEKPELEHSLLCFNESCLRNPCVAQLPFAVTCKDLICGLSTPYGNFSAAMSCLSAYQTRPNCL